MRILFITHEMSRSGAPLALLQELQTLRNNFKEFDFEILSLAEGPLSKEFQKICRTQCIKYGTRDKIKRWILRVLLKMDNVFGYKKGYFDLIYANTIGSHYLALSFKRIWNIPVIVHIHEGKILNGSTAHHKGLLLSYDYFITVSELAKKNLVSHLGISSSNILIQPPVSLWVNRYFHNELEIKPWQNNDKIIIGLCGSFNHEWVKGLDLVPIILKLFFSKHPNASVQFAYICSDSQNATAAKIRFQIEYDLTEIGNMPKDKFFFIEETDNPLPYYKRFDIFLMPSREESFSLSAQEAALMETPIVGFEGVTGIEEWLKNEGGIFVPYLDLEKMADTLYLLYSDRELRRRIGANAKRIAMDMYKQGSNIENVVKVIKSLTSYKNS